MPPRRTQTETPKHPFPIPAEITTEIFKQAIWESDETLTEALFYDGSWVGHPYLITPLTLGAVCRSWRTFVWDTPSLWSFIALPLTKTYHKHQLYMIDTFLERSGTHSLDIWLNYSDEDYLFSDRINIALQKLVDHSPRWRRLCMCLIPESTGILSQAKGRVPLLQACELQWEDYECANLPMTTLDMFENAPLLKRFTFTAGIISTESPINKFLVLPWEQLEYFEVEGISREGFVKNLTRCTNLTELVMDDAHVNDRKFPNGTTFDFPNLRSLVITYTQEEHLRTILRHMRCPQLRWLNISIYRTAKTISFSEIGDFITRSNCAIEDLQLENVHDVSHIPPLLEKQPSLQSLRVCNVDSRYSRENEEHKCHLCNRDDIDAFLNTLLTNLDLTTTDKPVFLPNLTELYCRIPPIPSSAPLPTPGSVDLLRVLQQRWTPPEGVSRVERVVVEDTFTFDESRDSSVVDGLRDLLSKGMDIQFLEEVFGVEALL